MIERSRERLDYIRLQARLRTGTNVDSVIRILLAGGLVWWALGLPV